MEKNILKILIAGFLLLQILSCKAQQQQYPINTMPFELPPNSYIKDLDNELDPYIGIWSAVYDGKQITLYINKAIKKNFVYRNKTYFKDALIVKYTIKDSMGNILQSTKDSTDDRRNFITNTVINTVSNQLGLYYTGTDCGIGWGNIEIKKLDSARFSWSYYPNSTTVNTVNCPNAINKTIYLPEVENLIFIKQ